MKTLHALNIFNVIFAFATSIVQTHRIIYNSTKKNQKNTKLLIGLAIFAVIASIVQTSLIIKNISKSNSQ